MDCACGCGRPARRKWATTQCRDRCRTDPSRQRNRQGLRADGTRRPSRQRHDQGLRADGTRRPNATSRNTRANDDRPGRMRRPFLECPPVALEASLPRTLLRLASMIPNGSEVVTWGLDAKVALWCSSCNRDTLRAIVDRQGRINPEHPHRPPWLRIGPVSVDYLPTHFLRFKTPSGRVITINEVARFFPFRAQPEGGLAELMTQFRHDCSSAGVVPRSWHGPGQGASTLLIRHRAKEELCPIDTAPKDAVRHAYFAHRFELAAPGIHPRLWSYDLVAAYPRAMSQVPCWRHGRWVHHMPPGPYIALISWELPAESKAVFGPFPWRYPDGYACHPAEGVSWVWSPEIRAAHFFPDLKWEILDVWGFEPDCDHTPWAWTNDYLAKRTEFPLLKKFLNSCPGKLVQSRPVRGPWFDPVSAGYLTSLVRATMLTAACIAGSHAVAITADCLWTNKEVELNAVRERSLQASSRAAQQEGPLQCQRGDPLPVHEIRGAGMGTDRTGLEESGKNAPGTWRSKAFEDVTFVRSEISYAGDEITAAAGTPAHALEGLQSFFSAAWQHSALGASVGVSYRHTTTVGEAALSGLAPGLIVDLRHEVSFDPGRKRAEWTDLGRRPAVVRTRIPSIDPFDPRNRKVPMMGDRPMSSPYWAPDWTPVTEPIEWPELVDDVG